MNEKDDLTMKEKDESVPDGFLMKFTAMSIGNTMEWFDFASVGAFADVFGELFFPGDDPGLQLLKSLSVFGAAFVARPFGGVVIGWIGDTFGRKRALEISILLMLLPSFLIGCLPTYGQVGKTATMLLVFLRLCQGLAVGGELVGAFIYTIESTKGVNRGFWGGAVKASGNLGTAMGMGLAAILRTCLSKEQLYSFGWRIPFLLGIVFGTVGLRLRASLTESQPDACEWETGAPTDASSTLGRDAQSELTSASAVGSNVKSGGPMRDLEAEALSQASGAVVRSEDTLHPMHSGLISFLDKDAPRGGHRKSDSYISVGATDREITKGGKGGGAELASSRNPFLWVIQEFWRECVLGVFITAFWGAGYYTTFVWLVYYMEDPFLIGGEGISCVWTVTFCINLMLCAGLPLGGYTGDRIGQWLQNETKGFATAMQLGCVILILVVVPAFLLLINRTILGTIAAQIMLAIPLILFGGNLPAMLMTLFPPYVRYSGVGLAYNLAQTLFSGTAPLIQTSLVLSNHFRQGYGSVSLPSTLSESRILPAYYLMLIAAISFIALTIAVASGIAKGTKPSGQKEGGEEEVLKVVTHKPSMARGSPCFTAVARDDVDLDTHDTEMSLSRSFSIELEENDKASLIQI
jgi:MFS family permease